MRIRHVLPLILCIAFAGVQSAAAADDQPPPKGDPQKQEATPPPTKEPPPLPPPDPELEFYKSLIEQIEQLKEELVEMRRQVAAVTLQRDEAVRELAELRQFIRDHREYGEDFAQYQEIKEITRQSERRRALEEARQRREEERLRRLEQRGAQDAISRIERAERERIEQYQRAGFKPLGLDVFLGRTGFFYSVDEQTGVRVEYEPFIGRFLTPATPVQRIDYSKMTISGTVLNASDEVRHLGIALAFFDARGNQIGSETIQIRNARPNVPYPFTTTIEMASNAPFSRSTSWVLFADRAAEGN